MSAPISPVEICRRLGEARAKGIFHELTTDGMKKVLREAKIPTARMPSHTSTRKRNDDWAARLWRHFSDKPDASAGAAATLLFEWLTRARRQLLGEFLTACEVKHDNGLTDADFLKDTPADKLIAAGKLLFEKHDRHEVAAYLSFLDASNNSEIFAPLELDKILTPLAAA